MVNFAALPKRGNKRKESDPIELFKYLTKSNGINDLYDIQASALKDWRDREQKQDVVIKMPTGSGKTLVGLLIAQASANELRKGSLFLVENNQLVSQAVAQAVDVGIRAAPFSRQTIGADFFNGDQIVVGSYKALFNGMSYFGLQGQSRRHEVGTIVFDDAHASLPIVREACSIAIPSNTPQYTSLIKLFARSFDRVDRTENFEDISSNNAGISYTVVEVPVSEWLNKTKDVKDILQKAMAENDVSQTNRSLYFGWPLLKSRLKFCRAIVSRNAFTITPYLPFTDTFVAFSSAARRVYMSATFSNDAEIVSTFGVSEKDAQNPIEPYSLAGVGKRMILPVPEGVKRQDLTEFALGTACSSGGVVIEVPSASAMSEWSNASALIAQGDDAENAIQQLMSGNWKQPVILVNRYNGVDLPGDSCRLVIMDGLPKGRSDFELLEDIQLSESGVSARALAQRIEQGLGRGSRGSSDYCAVLLFGHEICEWVRTEANSRMFTNATRAQLSVGQEIADAIEEGDYLSTVLQGVSGDLDFLSYCAQRTAEIMNEYEMEAEGNYELQAAHEVRKSWSLWLDGRIDQSVESLTKVAGKVANRDRQYAGILFQMASAISYDARQYNTSQQYQSRAHGLNSNLYREIMFAESGLISRQTRAIVTRVIEYKNKGKGVEEVRSELESLEPDSRPHDYEQALMYLGLWLGFDSRRYDNNGDGPDVFWFAHQDLGFALEVKNGKKCDSAYSKKDYGQLLVAKKWAEANYPDVEVMPVAVHHSVVAQRNAYAAGEKVLTTASVMDLRNDVMEVLSDLFSPVITVPDLEARCQLLIDERELTPGAILDKRIKQFIETK